VRRTARRPGSAPVPGAVHTLVAFHAHPDDEALLMGGTLARCVSEGHRVVLVVATAGERGLAADPAALRERRLAELDVAATALGVHRTIVLGYGDSGFDEDEPPPPGSFCAASVVEAADLLAAVLTEEQADILTIYDALGGYGHRDHLRVNAVGHAAARLAGTPVVLAATVDRAPLLRVLRLLHRIRVRPGGMSVARVAKSFSAPQEITHVVDVRRWVTAKRAALAAHASQASGGSTVRPVWLLSRLPRPFSRWALGREWFIDTSQTTVAQRSGDIFSTLHGPSAVASHGEPAP